MALNLNKKILFGFFILISNCLVAQSEHIDLSIQKEEQVERSFLSDSYKTSYRPIMLGQLRFLHFEFMSCESKGDSVDLFFVVWYCSYYGVIDKDYRSKNCQCNNELYKLKMVSVKNDSKRPIDDNSDVGVYEVVYSSEEKRCVNELQKITLKKSTEYNFVIELNRRNALYVKLIE